MTLVTDTDTDTKKFPEFKRGDVDASCVYVKPGWNRELADAVTWQADNQLGVAREARSTSSCSALLQERKGWLEDSGGLIAEG